MTIVSLLITILIIYLIWYLLGMLPLPPALRQNITVVFIVIAIVYLLQLLGVNTGIHLQ